MTPEELADIIKDHEQLWILHDNRENRLAVMAKKLDECYALFARQFGGDGITLDDQSIRNEPDRSRVQALLQALPSRSPEFIAGIWRIMHGDRIVSMHMQYMANESFHLQVVIESPMDKKHRTLTSPRIEDAAFLRYLWIGRVNDKPYFVGYFPPHGPQATPAST
jgi:hypothetical protein